MSPTYLLLVALAAVPSEARIVPPEEILVRLAVRPMAAPRPALRYLLLPELKELTPGNPVAGYYRCLLSQDFSAEKEALGKATLRQVDRAARMERPDWQTRWSKTTGKIESLADVQRLLVLVKGLRVRLRSEIAEHRFDEAIVTIKTMFAMARHLNDHPTLLGNLVGLAVVQLTIEPLQEMLAQPGCPNLYWALTNLPDPLVSISRGLEGQRAQFQNELQDLTDTAPMTPSQLKKVIEYIEELRGSSEKPSTQPKWLTVRTEDTVLVVAARSRLVEDGIPEERLAKFPVEQIILLDEKRRSEARSDELLKLLCLPAWQIEKLAAGIDQNSNRDSPFLPIEIREAFFLRYRKDQGIIEQRIALIRVIEALRLYAAGHSGQLPEKLTDIALPLPLNPFTGKQFNYSRAGGIAQLWCIPALRQ